MNPKPGSVLKKLGLAALFAVVVAVAGFLFFPGLPRPIKVYDVVQLNQQWTAEERQRYYHTSQGSELMPYRWLLALEQPENRSPFVEPDHLTRFRLIPDVNPIDNPDRLPVGFAKDEPDPVTGVENVGITCAGCHTAQLNYKGLGVRIDGAPGQVDFDALLRRIALGMTTTALDPLKLDRFARRVLGPRYGAATKRELKAQVRRYIGEHLGRILQQINADQESGLAATVAGFGRIDALGQGGNRLFGPLSARNLRSLDAPVNVIPLWNAHSYGWVQSNASIRQPMARNVIEALTSYSSLVLPGKPDAIYTTSVRLKNLHDLEGMMARLQAPQWPEWLFGRIDQDKAARGKVLYGKLCAGCHQPELERPTTNDHVPVVPGPYPPDPVSQAAGKRFYHLRIFNVDVIGTDPRDAVNFAGRTVDARAIGLGANEPQARAIFTVISGLLQRYYQQNGIPPEQQVSWSSHRANFWRAPRAYPARPLAGIWATAPFLHNGSVPNLYELLSPLEERAATFYTGDLEFDPVRVGYQSGRFYGGFKFDTSQPGNSNAGHEFRDEKGKGRIGRRLTEDERWQLVEYLKALRFENEAAGLTTPEG